MGEPVARTVAEPLVEGADGIVDRACGKTHPRGPCFTVGKVPPPIYYIDLSKIPLPPPGSDAEKIAKGEMRAP